MDDRNRTLEKLTEENRKLKEDRELLLDILVQMKLFPYSSYLSWQSHASSLYL